MMAQYGTKGISFPFRLDGRGQVAVSDIDLAEGRVDHVEEGLRQLYGTRIGERFFRRDFGANLTSIVFRPNSPEEFALWVSELEEPIRKWEPRVTIENVRILEQFEHYLHFSLIYRVLGHNVGYTFKYLVT